MVKALFKDFIDTIYPSVCKGCSTFLLSDEEVLCLNCEYDMPVTNFHHDPENPLLKKFQGRINLSGAASLYYFKLDGKVQSLIHNFKYKDRPQVARYLGKKYGYQLKGSNLVKNIDCIVPVPLHPKKERSRGYNQSEVFAYGLSEVLNIPVDTNHLLRMKNNFSQTTKNRFLRFNAIESSFKVILGDDLIRKHILLVDDVITTGATIEACSKMLLEIEGVEVSVVSVAARVLE